MNIPSSSSKSKYQLSGRAHPCPVCDRTHDADCKSAERGNLVYCHTNQREALNTLRNGYHYVGEVKRGAGWGLWVRNPADKKDRVPEKKTEYFYPDRSGKPFIKVIRQKGNNPEFWQEYWIDGEWLAPTKAKRKGHDAIVQGMKSQVPIYRYAEVQESIAAGKPIFIVVDWDCQHYYDRRQRSLSPVGELQG
jgi:hypothetical protein